MDFEGGLVLKETGDLTLTGLARDGESRFRLGKKSSAFCLLPSIEPAPLRPSP
jgi:hypothetical protein